MKYRPHPFFILLRHYARAIDKKGLFGASLEPFERVVRYFRNHGSIGTLRRFVRKPPAAPLPENEAIPQGPHPFDQLHGTDTSGYFSCETIPGKTLSAMYTTAYLGTTPSALTQALAALPIRHEDFTFVDIGCGKGRALIIASQFPFRHLLGVELTSELCDIARRNMTVAAKNVSRITVVNEDATKITYPDGPLLLFLFNPFLKSVLQRVLANLERQLRRSPRPAYVLYEMNPRYKNMERSFLREISDTAYTFSPEEVVYDHLERTEEHFTLYSANFYN